MLMATEKELMLIISRSDGHYEHWAMLTEDFIRLMKWRWLIVTQVKKHLRTVINGRQ